MKKINGETTKRIRGGKILSPMYLGLDGVVLYAVTIFPLLVKLTV